MKEGSLIVILPSYAKALDLVKKHPDTNIKWIPCYDGNIIYTVERITSSALKLPLIILEEGEIGLITETTTNSTHIIGIPIEHCREIAPPISSKEIMQLVEDCEFELV